MRAGVRMAIIAACLAVVAGPAASASAQSAPGLPTNDLEDLLALTGWQTPARAPIQHVEPELQPAPRADCSPGSTPLAGEQGRVPPSAIDSPEAARGWTCNLSVVSRYDATPGGFRTWRYTDVNHHTCAFYDSS